MALSVVKWGPGGGGQLAWWQMPGTVPRKRSLKTLIHLSARPGAHVSSGVNEGLQMGLVTGAKRIESRTSTLLPGTCPQNNPPPGSSVT